MVVLDAGSYPPIEYERFRWLYSAGVPLDLLVALLPIRVAKGRRAADGIFEDDEAGSDFLVLEDHPHDLVFWSPRSGEIATAVNRAFALGEYNIDFAATYALDGALALYSSPLDWLRDRCRGAVILDWSRAFDRLRDAPRIAVTSDLVNIYKNSMRPARLPKLSVMVQDRKGVAA